MKTLKNSILAIVLVLTANVFAQTTEVDFDTYSTSKQYASRYLLADDVSLRDCPSTQCERLTTIGIGTNVRLLEKSEKTEVIDGVISRWYRIKIGPQSGWVWGGLISQKSFESKANAQVRFMIGDAGYSEDGEKQYQIRAINSGVELDKRIIKAQSLNLANVETLGNKGVKDIDDVISINKNKEGSCNVTNGSLYLVWKNNRFEDAKSIVYLDDVSYENESCSIFPTDKEN